MNQPHPVQISPTPPAVIDAQRHAQAAGLDVPGPRGPVDLNAIREAVHNDQLARPQKIGVYVDESGNLVLLSQDVEGRAPERLTRVSRETFFAPDLNRIAATIRANQERGVVDPTRRDKQLYVDEEGAIYNGGEVDPNNRRLSRVTQETFFLSPRLQEEVSIVADKMPVEAVYASDGQYEGWFYPVVTEFGDRFELFLWYEPGSRTYKVSLVEPRLGGSVGVHDCHVYDDGTLCLKQSGGYARMEDAYARSVLWTRGASCYLRGYGFQFNVDQG